MNNEKRKWEKQQNKTKHAKTQTNLDKIFVYIVETKEFSFLCSHCNENTRSIWKTLFSRISIS